MSTVPKRRLAGQQRCVHYIADILGLQGPEHDAESLPSQHFISIRALLTPTIRPCLPQLDAVFQFRQCMCEASFAAWTLAHVHGAIL